MTINYLQLCSLRSPTPSAFGLIVILLSLVVASQLWGVDVCALDSAKTIMSLNSEEMSTTHKTDESAGSAWAFLTTGIGARAMGMGGAFVAVADDATASYWNPAGVGLLKRGELTFMVIESDHDIYPLTNRFLRRHQYLSSILPIAIRKFSGRFGISGNYFSIGGIQHTEGTAEFDFKRHEYFDDKEWALTVSCGFSFPDFQNPDRSWLFLGGNIRSMRQSFFHLSTTGFGGDLGFILKSGSSWRILRNFRLGWVWNINLPRKWSSDSKEVTVSASYSDPAVIEWKWGFAVDAKVKSTTLTPAFTLTYHREGSPVTGSLGIEISLARLFFLRAGVEDVWLNENSLHSSFTAGSGLKLSYLQLDYAAVFENLDTKHRISTTVRY